MNKSSKRTTFLKEAGLILLLVAGVKIFWVLIETLWLTPVGVSQVKRSGVTPLHYPITLASNAPLPKAPASIKKSPHRSSIRDLTLVAIYQGPDHQLAVIGKGAAFHVVSPGDSIFGYRLERLEGKEAILNRGGKEYRLVIKGGKIPSPSVISPAKENEGPSSQNLPDILHRGDTTVVSKKLLASYGRHTDKIWKEIGIVPEKAGGAIRGFRIRFVQRHSVFDRLGLRRGDLITAINGETVTDYRLPFELFRSRDKLDNLTLEIKRGTKKVELNYEIR